MSVKSNQKRALPLWLPLPLVHYPNRGECTPIQVFIHRGKLGIWGNEGTWGNVEDLSKRREQKKRKRKSFIPCSSFSLSLHFLASSFSISLISFSSLFISSFYNSSFSIPLLSLFCLVLSCIGMYFDAVEGSLIVGIRPRSNTDLSSPLSRLSSYVPSPPSSSSPPLSLPS